MDATHTTQAGVMLLSGGMKNVEDPVAHIQNLEALVGHYDDMTYSLMGKLQQDRLEASQVMETIVAHAINGGASDASVTEMKRIMDNVADVQERKLAEDAKQWAITEMVHEQIVPGFGLPEAAPVAETAEVPAPVEVASPEVPATADVASVASATEA